MKRDRTQRRQPKIARGEAKQLQLQLVAASKSRALVRVRRSCDSGWLCGYVVEVGPQLVAMLVISDHILFDGFTVFRIQDVSSVESPALHASFAETALRLRRQEPPTSPNIDLTDLRSLLLSATAAFPLVTVHREIEDPDICHIGIVQEIVGDTLHMQLINPDAEWYAEPDEFSVSAITRVDLGGLYEQALSLVADSRPRVGP